MKVYRIATKKYADLEGLGGMFAWGRWHSKGNRVVYASESRALAAWEKIVHVGDLSLLPDNLVIMEIEIPDDNIMDVPDIILSKEWKDFPYSKHTVNFGTHFLKSNMKLVLRVPSVIISYEYNFIINPNHPDFKDCKINSITPFVFDSRIS